MDPTKLETPAETLQLRIHVFFKNLHTLTGRNRIQCRAIVGSISGQGYYEFGVNEMQQSGLVLSRL